MVQIPAASVNRAPVDLAGPSPAPFTARVPGHFGELVQGRLGPCGPVALVTLPCPVLVSEARFSPAWGPLEVATADSAKIAAAAGRVLRLVAPEGWGGRLEIGRASKPGSGAGSSTAEVLATIRAVAGAFGRGFGPDEEAALCLAAEGAVDPLMHAGTVLFASREARVVRRLGDLPAARVVGGFAGPGAATNPADDGFPDMAPVFAGLAEAIAAGDAAAMADAARVSAEANQARNPNPAWQAVLRAGREVGALGPIVAHTGSAIGLILSPDTPPGPARQALAAIGLGGIIVFDL